MRGCLFSRASRFRRGSNVAPLIRNGCLDVFEFAMQLRRDGETGHVPPGTQDNQNLIHVVQNLRSADNELTERRAEMAHPGQPSRLGKDLVADVRFARQFGMNADADFGAEGLEELCHCDRVGNGAIVRVKCLGSAPARAGAIGRLPAAHPRSCRGSRSPRASDCSTCCSRATALPPGRPPCNWPADLRRTACRGPRPDAGSCS